VGDLLNTVDANSRDRNNALRGTNERIDPILFDQILFPVWMKDKYVPGSAKVFDRAVGAAGNDFNRASDHLPVFADFVFDEADDDGPIPSGVRIVSLLANPTGDDDKKEEITIGNFTSSNLNLSGFKLRDKAKQLYKLSGTVPAHTKLTIIMVENTMPLNNSGDEVVLLDDHGTVVHKVSYTATEAGPGKVIHF
jgi:hypothetical protein